MLRSKSAVWFSFALALTCSFVKFSTAKAQIKDFANRKEGTFQPQGLIDIELLGLARSSIHFNHNSELHVRFFLPRYSDDHSIPVDLGTVKIEAHELIQTHNYMMESKAQNWNRGDWNTFSGWQSAAFLDPLGIDGSNLAVSASFGTGSGMRVYLPVQVTDGVTQSTPTLYTFKFSTAKPIHSFQRTLIRPDGSTENLPNLECTLYLTCILYDAGTPFAFNLDMANRPPGIYRLQLTGQVPDTSDTPTVSVPFYHTH
jgi:hypothetical protein